MRRLARRSLFRVLASSLASGAVLGGLLVSAASASAAASQPVAAAHPAAAADPAAAARAAAALQPARAAGHLPARPSSRPPPP